MDLEANIMKSVGNIEKSFKVWNKAGGEIVKLVKQARKDITSCSTQNKIPVSIPLHMLVKKVTDKGIMTDMSFIDSLTPEVIDHIVSLSITDSENSQSIIDKVVPENVNFIRSQKKIDNKQPQKSTTDSSLKRKITNKDPKDLSENSVETKVMKKSHKNSNSANKTNNTNGTKANETNKIIEINVEPKNKNSCEKGNETDAPNNGNPNAADQNDIGINVGIMGDIIQASQNYKDMFSKLTTSALKMYRLGKCVVKKEVQDKICQMFDMIVMVCISISEESAKENSDETNLETQSNDNNNSEEIQLHLQMMKQEKEDEDDVATVIAEVINRPEINTVPEKQTEVPQVTTIQQEKRREPTPQKTNNTYNYFDKHNTSINQNKNVQTIVNETRPPCPPSTTPNLQHNLYYNNQNSYNNQESTKKNFKYPTNRQYNRQTPQQRYPQQNEINQIQMQQLSHNQQAYIPYQQYGRPQNTHIPTQMQGAFSHNPPYH